MIRTLIVCFVIQIWTVLFFEQNTQVCVCWKCSQWFLYFSITLFLFPVVMPEHHQENMCVYRKLMLKVFHLDVDFCVLLKEQIWARINIVVASMMSILFFSLIEPFVLANFHQFSVLDNSFNTTVWNFQLWTQEKTENIIKEDFVVQSNTFI